MSKKTNPDISPYGTKMWFIDNDLYRNALHRINGPAVVFKNGSVEWYIYGKRHHADGPAIKRANGKKEWFINGNRHRIDGPAIEYPDGTKAWFVDGNRIPDEWIKDNIIDITNITKEEQVLMQICWGGEL